jgi:hypothetical protein
MAYSWGGWCSSEPVGAYGAGLGKNIRRGWENFAITLDLRWEMAPMLDSGIIFGVGIWPLRMLLLLLTWNFLEVPFSEM